MQFRGSHESTTSRDSSDAEARSAAATRLRVGVEHLERGTAKILDEIDRRASDKVEADRIDDELHAVRFGDLVVALRRVCQLELIGEAGAAAAVDGKAQDRGLRLPFGDPGDALRRILGKANVAHVKKVGSAALCGKASLIC